MCTATSKMPLRTLRQWKVFIEVIRSDLECEISGKSLCPQFFFGLEARRDSQQHRVNFRKRLRKKRPKGKNAKNTEALQS